jgi:hypothetical protein
MGTVAAVFLLIILIEIYHNRRYKNQLFRQREFVKGNEKDDAESEQESLESLVKEKYSLLSSKEKEFTSEKKKKNKKRLGSEIEENLI